MANIKNVNATDINTTSNDVKKKSGRPSKKESTPKYIRPLRTLNGDVIDGTIILNRYYQRNCVPWVPIMFMIFFIAMNVFMKYHALPFPWYINLCLYVIDLILLIISVYTVANFFKFTKFFEIKITDGAKATELLENYHIVEQRGEIYTVTIRTEEMRFGEKFRENYMKASDKKRKLPSQGTSYSGRRTGKKNNGLHQIIEDITQREEIGRQMKEIKSEQKEINSKMESLGGIENLEFEDVFGDKARENQGK